MVELVLHKIRKDFDERRVLAGVSCELDTGIVALLGANGAGKSTLLHILSTQMTSSSGYFILDGLHSEKDGEEIRKKIGMIGHRSFLYRHMNVRENLLFYAQLYTIQDAEERIMLLAQQFKMEERLNSRIFELSRGLLQRVAIMRALLHEPRLLLFDEPFTGLDTYSSGLLIEQLQEWRTSSRLVILTTHDLKRASSSAKRFLFLHNGKLKSDVDQVFSLTELQEKFIEFSQ